MFFWNIRLSLGYTSQEIQLVIITAVRTLDLTNRNIL
jgi:hypothetical protein